MNSEAITWENIYSVGIEEIDMQHKKLLEIINELDELLNADITKSGIEAVLVELKEYIEIHFSTEEEYMEKYHYPDLAEHKMLHKEFIAKIKNAECIEDATIEGIEVIDFLYNWLINHIMVEDKKYVPYMIQA